MSVDPGRLERPMLSPSTLALLYVGYDAGDDAVLEVCRHWRRFVRRWAVYSVLAALLLAIVPALVVVGRTEPAYLTNWVLLVAGIAFVVITAAGAVGAWLWSRSAAGRRQFDAPVLTITSNGLVIPTRDGPMRTGWERVTAARLYGRREVFLAIQVVAAAAEPSPDPEVDRDVEPDTHAQLDTDIEPDDDAIKHADPPINVDGHYTGGPAGAGPKPAAPSAQLEQSGALLEQVAARPAALPDDRWSENLYGARFVIDLRECSPPISDICETISAVTHGRLDPRGS